MLRTDGRVHRTAAIVTAAATVLLGLPIALSGAQAAPAVARTRPTTPPARICGNAGVLDGPVAPPAGAVRVNPGQNLHAQTLAHPAGTTFWLAPGTHVLGNDQFDQVVPKAGNTYLGGPGAVLDGRGVNRYAFGQGEERVGIRHLTIRGFVAPNNEGVVNHDSRRGWVVEANTITANSGAGVMVGSDNVVRDNCLAANGQYGFSVFSYGGVTNVTLVHNEITANNTDDWEVRIPGCGCAGAGKVWETTGAVITDNWVHDNRGPGLWADYNNAGIVIEGNYIDNNDGEGIFYEISYNARIAHNTLRGNAVVKGRALAARGDTFPVGAIYVSESGGDARVDGGRFSTMEITANHLQDNWGGVVLWENADRFCGSPVAGGDYCTRGGTATAATCAPPGIANRPAYDDCRWRTQNVSVHDNDFIIDKAALRCAGTLCGLQAVVANFGSYPSWSPYMGRVVQESITFAQNVRFSANRYSGDWRFNPYEPSRLVDITAWQAAPYWQDGDSTFSSSPVPTTTTTTIRTTTTTTTTTPPAPNVVTDVVCLLLGFLLCRG